MLNGGREAKTVLLANELRRHSGTTEKDNEYDKRTVFGCTPGARASGSNCARDDFDLL
jgi:hypothetical protein